MNEQQIDALRHSVDAKSVYECYYTLENLHKL